MYVKTTARKTKNGEVRYLQLAHNEWDAAARRSVPKIVYSFGREDQLDTDAIRRLVTALSRLLSPADALAATADGDLVFTGSRPYGGAYVLDQLWTRLGIAKILAGLASSGAGRAAGRRRSRAGAVRAGRQPGAGPVFQARAVCRSGSASARMTLPNPAKSSDCGPSESARSGQGCTSMISPSAPTATAARDTAAIRLCLPVPCDGSAITGRCDRSRASATAARSIVLRISVSKVLMPRSHSTTC